MKVIMPILLSFASLGSCYHDYQNYKVRELRRMKKTVSFIDVLSKGGKIAELSISKDSEKIAVKLIERSEIVDIGILLITEGKQSKPGFFPFTVWNGSYKELLGDDISIVSEMPVRAVKNGFKKLVAYV
jgi:hypothetical protein